MRRNVLRTVLVVLILLIGCTSEAIAFKVTAPVEHAILQPGQEIAASVDLGTDIAVGRVRYYWYRLGEEPMVTQLASPALVSTGGATPPYGGTLKVPVAGLGAMRLLVIGEVVRGR